MSVLPGLPSGEGVLNRQANTTLKTIGFLLAMIAIGVAITVGAISLLRVPEAGAASGPQPQVAAVAAQVSIEAKIDRIDERVRSLQIDVATIKATLDPRGPAPRSR